MKVISNGRIDPYTKNRTYEYIILIDPNTYESIYYVPCPEVPQGSQGGYSDKFSKEYFDRFFITIAELRKQKLKKLNESYENIH